MPECKHEGECLGTCPRCEWEVRFLERELEKRRKSGAKVVLAGVSAGLVAVNAVACAPFETAGNMELDGDVAYTESAESEGQTVSADTAETDGTASSDTTDEAGGSEAEGEVVDVTDIAGEVTEELWLDGDVAFVPETDEEIFTTKGDIAYFPDTEEETEHLAGAVPLLEDTDDE